MAFSTAWYHHVLVWRGSMIMEILCRTLSVIIITDVTLCTLFDINLTRHRSTGYIPTQTKSSPSQATPVTYSFLTTQRAHLP